MVRDEDTFVFYNFQKEVININPEGAQIQLGLLEGILIGLFEHLSNKMSWKFIEEGSEESLEKQREETQKFVEKFFFRCSELGLLPPPTRS